MELAYLISLLRVVLTNVVPTHTSPGAAARMARSLLVTDTKRGQAGSLKLAFLFLLIHPTCGSTLTRGAAFSCHSL